MAVHILILNYNGQALLPECLPSVLAAARAASVPCTVSVIDNASSDGSVSLLQRDFPSVPVVACKNHGLCSFNTVLQTVREPVCVLLNNDIKLHKAAIDPLVQPLLPGPRHEPDCFLTAPRAYLFDEATYEGEQAAVWWRFGLVRATSLYPGHEGRYLQPGLTASAGAAMAVRRDRFLELGGFDARYLPGRIEDLDFCYRGFQAGFVARYVPEAVCFHKGQATFEQAFGAHGCDQLALRNTFLFQWKNLRHPWHLLAQCAALPLRLAWDVTPWPGKKGNRWLALSRALLQAGKRQWQLRSQRAPLQAACSTGVIATSATPRAPWRVRLQRERAFFRQFHPKQLAGAAANSGGAMPQLCLENGEGP